MDKVDLNYKKAFNRGYEIAKEMNLKTPLFANQNKDGVANNPIQSGMLQYIEEQSVGIKISQEKIKNNSISRVKGKNNGKGLTL